MDKPQDRDSLLARIKELEERLSRYEGTAPSEDAHREEKDFTFESLFDPAAIQELQDKFSRTVRLGSVITAPDGTPLTRPSHFTHLCEGVIRQTAQGLKNCIRSDALIGQYSADGPIIQRCRSGGLWDAGAAIIVKGKHIASWLIGQIRDPSMGDGDIRRYAREIGADEEETAAAFRQIPVMGQDDFRRIADLLYLLANQISELAYQNYLMTGTIRKNERIYGQLKRSETYLRTVISSIPDILWIRDPDERFLHCNPRFEELLGEPRENIAGKRLSEFDDNPGMISLMGSKGFPPKEDRVFRKEEELIFRRDGHRETSEIIRVPVKDENNRILGFLGIGRDVTAYKELVKEHQEISSP